MRKVIRDASIVNEGKIIVSDLLITGGKIEKIDPHIEVSGFADEINAAGKYLFPGIIDDQVHFREPGLTHKATIYSEAKAAVAGGVTSFMEMPNTIPAAITLELLEDKYRLAGITSLCNYSFFLGTSNFNIEEIKKADPKQICGVKIFMGSSTGSLTVNEPEALENIFRFSPMLIATHCETDSVIRLNEEKFRKQYGLSIPMEKHPEIRNEAECYTSSKHAIELAKTNDSRLHILHLSTGEEIDLFTNQLPLKEKKITCEACVHHLWFDSTDYSHLGGLIKCNPAIKDSWHKQKLLEGLLDDHIDLIATDHAPHTWDEKFALTPEGKADYFKTPSGIPLVQHSFNMMLEFYFDHKISLPKIAEKMSHAPAIAYQISNRGFIREGYYADLVLVDLQREWQVSKNNILYKCGWSPLEGEKMRSCITHTFINGRLAFNEGKFDESVNGMRLEFARQ